MRIKLAIVLSLLFVCAGTVVLYVIVLSHPRLSVPTSCIELGMIDETFRETRIEWQLKNVGWKDLRIRKVLGDCPCLRLALDKRVIPRGGCARLSATVSPPKSPGVWEDKIRVWTNDPHNAQIALRVKAYVKLRYKLVPPSVSVEGLRRSETKHVMVSVYGPSDDTAFAVEDHRATDTDIHVAAINEVECADRNRKQWEIEIAVRGKGKSIWHANVVLLTNHAQAHELVIPVTVVEDVDILVSPTLLLFKRDDASPRRLSLKFNNMASPEAIASISAPTWVKVVQLTNEAEQAEILFAVAIDGNGAPTEIARNVLRILFKDPAKTIEVPLVIMP